MSQEKVERYKQEKANRRKTMRKERLMSMTRKLVLSLAGLALVGWIGYSAIDSWIDSRPRQMVEINYEAIDNYLVELSQ